MSAIFDFSSLITVLLLCICTTAYLRELRPGVFDAAKEVRQPCMYSECICSLRIIVMPTNRAAEQSVLFELEPMVCS